MWVEQIYISVYQKIIHTESQIRNNSKSWFPLETVRKIQTESLDLQNVYLSLRFLLLVWNGYFNIISVSDFHIYFGMNWIPDPGFSIIEIWTDLCFWVSEDNTYRIADFIFFSQISTFSSEWIFQHYLSLRFQHLFQNELNPRSQIPDGHPSQY